MRTLMMLGEVVMRPNARFNGLASFGPDLAFEGALRFTRGFDGEETEVEYGQLDSQCFDHRPPATAS